jgi:hypothetical protein
MGCSSWERITSHFWKITWNTMAALLVLLFFTPAVISGAESYYYIQISSFRQEKRAVKYVETLQDQGYNAVAKRERIPNRGYWYRVYIGPFSSLEEANMKRTEAIDRKLSQHPFITKTDSVITSSIGKPPEKEGKKVPVEREKEIPEVSPLAEYIPPPPEQPGEIPSPPEKPSEETEALPEEAPAQPEELKEALPAPEKPPAAEKMPPLVPSLEEHEEIKAPPPQEAPTKSPAKIKEKAPREKIERIPRENGRNMGRDQFSLGLKHTYRHISLNLTKRTCITSDDSATTVKDGDDNLTKFHMDSLRGRYGVTDYLEVFAEIGGAYRELFDFNFVYGGGLRLNLFQVKRGLLRGFYSALQGEFLYGEVDYEYDSITNDTWEKKSEWEEFVLKGELGLVHPRFTAYIGAFYFDYQEETERELLEDLPPVLLKDELEEEESFGAFGGIDINLSSKLLLTVEGQVNGQKSIFGTLEYRF